MQNVYKSQYVSALLTDIRDRNSSPELLQKRLFELGELMGKHIAGEEMTIQEQITTPMGHSFTGRRMIQSRTVVLSTLDDYQYFALGISSVIVGSMRGFMDFAGVRGPDALSSPIRAATLPEVKTGQKVKIVIIAKSVLATGCTAITLAKKAYENYYPEKLIIATVFYSQTGIDDVVQDLPNPRIFVVGEPDSLDSSGMLVPGIGNIDNRIISCQH